MEQQKKVSSFKDIAIHRHDWIVDKSGRVMVVIGFWYEKEEKYRVQILEQGKSTSIEPWPLYTDIQTEIFEGNMKFFIK
ncbi:hypothetical protein [Pedobacter sp.]|uniref:hypothetical protein n=1 Tax=Pedobacter sp. TaxID=1411316 RepID=UPI0031E2D19A